MYHQIHLWSTATTTITITTMLQQSSTYYILDTSSGIHIAVFSHQEGDLIFLFFSFSVFQIFSFSGWSSSRGLIFLFFSFSVFQFFSFSAPSSSRGLRFLFFSFSVFQFFSLELQPGPRVSVDASINY